MEAIPMAAMMTMTTTSMFLEKRGIMATMAISMEIDEKMQTTIRKHPSEDRCD
jgi:hypothetical protein